MALKHDNPRDLWIVVKETGKRYQRHTTIESAIFEAHRLNSTTGHTFTVCKVKGSVRAQEAANAE